jgi:6-phosphogluconolactonase (cycloisomerase 2 family)
MSTNTAVATQAARTRAPGGQGVVFVHANDPGGNAVIAFRRGDDGVLSRDRSYPTGGLGAEEAEAPADPLASQRSMEYDDEAARLYVVNAGSDTVSVFDVDGFRLRPVQVVASGGSFPVSVTARGGLVYVLNAGGDGAISGFRSGPEGLVPIPASTRMLGLGNATPPFFLSSPGQVGFTADGRYLVVTTKNHDTLLAFAVDEDGAPADRPVVTPSAGRVPFAFVVTPDGAVVVAEASGSVSSYRVEPDGRLTAVSPSVTNGQQATCWIARAKRHVYAVNAGSGTVSAYAVDPGGRLRLLGRDGVTAHVGAGAIDVAATPDGGILYVENGASATVHPFRVEQDGSLLPLPETSGLPRFGGHSVEGIVAL